VSYGEAKDRVSWASAVFKVFKSNPLIFQFILDINKHYRQRLGVVPGEVEPASRDQRGAGGENGGLRLT
jgi:hypothetical protein